MKKYTKNTIQNVILKLILFIQQDIKTSKYQSSSVEDLINLFVAEKEAVIFLNQAKSKLKDDQTEVIDQFLDLIDYDV